jgi:hypothetical protein
MINYFSIFIFVDFLQKNFWVLSILRFQINFSEFIYILNILVFIKKFLLEKLIYLK